MITKIFFVLLIHLIVLVAYPHTGPMGTPYLWISALVWCGVLFFLSVNIISAVFLGKFFGELITIAFFTALIATLVSTMPQKDKVSVLGKLGKGIYPTQDSVYYGLLRVGIPCDSLRKQSLDDINTGVKKAIKEMKR
ncbi:MAG: hypothetical protein A2021_06335 [Elusimicrobia bacterium GWF2_52_66]|nr:MAG: hypothetical protein A2X33_02885 [Elusimicrobia bacterium GWA2_51_34]OGR86590.1 MAG: hypothetical protein A2021_06335 [Elusimicrobia bacterium GWF2_52_66]HAF95573.1 hypothetical protein [Elusimicrobiota bacterium]HCE97682.1 hypothetical protein [Elusimicrobiota bacterium]